MNVQHIYTLYEARNNSIQYFNRNNIYFLLYIILINPTIILKVLIDQEQINIMQVDPNKIVIKNNMPPLNKRTIQTQQSSQNLNHQQGKQLSYTPTTIPQIHIHNKILQNHNGYDSIKSPSPDHDLSRVLTPSKVKYLAQDKSRIKGMDRTPYSSEKSFVKIFQQPSETHTHDGIKTYVIQLEHQVNVLTIQNRNLIRRIESKSEIQVNRCTLSHVTSNAKNSNTNSHTNISNQDSKNFNNQQNYETKTDYRSQKGGRRNMLIIQKIKQQYKDNLSTLKLMIEHQIKQNISVVEEACRALESQVIQLQNRLQSVQNVAHMAKVRYILSQHQNNNSIDMQQYRSASPSKSKFSHKNVSNLGQNTISDILCVSIPEEQWQQSRNSAAVVKLQQQIQKLRKKLSQKQQKQEHYLKKIKKYQQNNQQQQQYITHLKSQLQQTNTQIQNLKGSISNNNINPTVYYNPQIKQQLLLLQTSISELADQLLYTKQLYNSSLLEIQNKNNQVEVKMRDMLILRDKIVQHEKNNILIKQKNQYLQQLLDIANRQLKERKDLLEDAINARSVVEKQKIGYLRSMNTTQQILPKNSSNAQNSGDNSAILDLTYRIDRLLQLQQQRENSLKVLHKNPFTGISVSKNQKQDR